MTRQGWSRQAAVDNDDHLGRGLMIIGLAALCRASCADLDAPRASAVGEPVEIRLEQLSGDAWRLLPGVGEVLAARLEQARLDAGGHLDQQGIDDVPGVGPRLLARWLRLQAR